MNAELHFTSASRQQTRGCRDTVVLHVTTARFDQLDLLLCSDQSRTRNGLEEQSIPAARQGRKSAKEELPRTARTSHAIGPAELESQESVDAGIAG